MRPCWGRARVDRVQESAGGIKIPCASDRDDRDHGERDEDRDAELEPLDDLSPDRRPA
jgi:hypothetical protein